MKYHKLLRSELEDLEGSLGAGGLPEGWLSGAQQKALQNMHAKALRRALGRLRSRSARRAFA